MHNPLNKEKLVYQNLNKFVYGESINIIAGLDTPVLSEEYRDEEGNPTTLSYMKQKMLDRKLYQEDCRY